MPHRPTQPPDRQQPRDRPVSPPPPDACHPWNFLVTRKTTPAVEVMTKRELFAAMAMQGMLSDHTYDPDPPEVAIHAVRVADALLAELAKPTE